MVQQYDPVQNWRLDQSAVRQSRLHELSGWQVSHQSMTEAQGKPSNAAFGLIRPSRLHSEPIGSKIKISPKQLQDISVAHSQRRPKPTMPNVSILLCCSTCLWDVYTIVLKHFSGYSNHRVSMTKIQLRQS